MGNGLLVMLSEWLVVLLGLFVMLVGWLLMLLGGWQCFVTSGPPFGRKGAAVGAGSLYLH